MESILIQNFNFLVIRSLYNFRDIDKYDCVYGFYS